LSLRIAGATHFDDALIYVGFAGPAVQVWAGDQFFFGGGVGIGMAGGCSPFGCGGRTGTGLDFRAGYAFHQKGYSGGNFSFEATSFSNAGVSFNSFSVLLGYQHF